MLHAAALIPDTALLVPGAAGGLSARDEDPARTLRAAAVVAVAESLAGCDRVVVVAPGRADRQVEPPVRGSLAAAGVPDEMLRWPAPGPAGAVLVGVPAAIGLFVVARAVAHRDTGGDARVVEVGSGGRHGGRSPAGAAGRTTRRRTGRATELQALGAELVASGRRTALVVVGSPSGRHGPDAPLADDPRAPGYDHAVLADLADAGPAARARLAALDPALAAELAVTGWAPWQVLLGAAGEAPVGSRLLVDEVLAGACHAVLTWRAAA